MIGFIGKQPFLTLTEKSDFLQLWQQNAKILAQPINKSDHSSIDYSKLWSFIKLNQHHLSYFLQCCRSKLKHIWKRVWVIVLKTRNTNPTLSTCPLVCTESMIISQHFPYRTDNANEKNTVLGGLACSQAKCIYPLQVWTNIPHWIDDYFFLIWYL